MPWYVSTTPDNMPTAEQLAAVEQRIGVPVEFDRTGGLSCAIDVLVACNRLECTLIPRSVRVSRDSPVVELVDAGGVVVVCQTYNEIIRALRRLLCTFDEVLTRRRPSAERSLDFFASHTALRTLQMNALARLDQIMGVGVITLHALNREIDYVDRCHRYYQRALARIDCDSPPAPPTAELKVWDDEDTFDRWEKDGP